MESKYLIPGALYVAAVAAIAMATAAGCGSSSNSTTSSTGSASSTSSTSSGHSTSSGSSTGSTASSGSGSSTTSSSSGGSGCLDASQFATLFTIEDTTLCAVAIYTADADLSGVQPSWGAHGGPLTIPSAGGSDGSVTLTRWTAPSGSTGALTSTTDTIDAHLGASDTLDQPAVDLGFFGLTAFAYTGMSPPDGGAGYAGAIDLVDAEANDAGVALAYATNDTFSLAAIATDATHGRLLYTGQSPAGSTTEGTNSLYASDSCGTASAPELGNAADASCAPVTVATWGIGSGPVVVDSSGNAFVAMFAAGDGGTFFSDVRGFAASAVARGAGPATPVSLFTEPNDSGSLAALAPTASADGILAFQPYDYTTTYVYADVVGQHYTVTGSTLAASGSPTTLLHVPNSATEVLLFTDTKGRLWAGVPGTTSTTFVVLGRAS